MFESQPQSEIDSLIKSDRQFKALYQHHRKLDKKVTDAALGVLPIGRVALVRMKREKLLAKQRLQRMYEAAH